MKIVDWKRRETGPDFRGRIDIDGVTDLLRP